MAKDIEEKIGAMSQKNWHVLKYKNPLKNYRVQEMPTGDQLPPHYLPFLATAAKTILPHLGIGALTGVANAGVQKLMGKGLYLKKGGCVCRVETDGKGLYLDPVNGSGLRLFGDGLYLKQGNKFVDGRGLLLGPNSPFKNIPILGMIL